MPAEAVSELAHILTEDQLRRAMDTAIDGMIVIDSSGTVVLYNSACERLFGYAADEVLGNNVKLFMTSSDRGNHDAYLRNYLRTGTARIIGIGRDVTGRRKDGSTVPLRLSVGELRDGNGRLFFVGTVHDLTEVQRARERIEELQSELMRVSRASAVGELGSALAHELTQPLSAIAGFVEASAALINQGGDQVPAGVRELMDKAVAQTLRAGHVVRRLREFTRRGEAERSAEDINAVVEEICELATLGMANNGIAVEMNLAADLPPVLIDSVQIQQVVLNLVRNSIDALIDRDAGVIAISTARRGDMVEVVVRDNGPGLPPEARERLFEPFFSTKPDGIGIGLSICRTIVEAQGGEINVDTNADGGTAFRFTVPAFVETGG